MKLDHQNAKMLYEGLKVLGFSGPEPQTNMTWVNAQPLNLTWESIIEKFDSIQVSTSERILIEGEGNVARIVVHFQTPSEGVKLLLDYLKKSLQLLGKQV
jgi:threonine aldolase